MRPFLHSGFILLMNLFCFFATAQGVWNQKPDLPGAARGFGAGFSIGSKGYIATGYSGSYYNDMWCYDTLTNMWTAKASFPGAARGYAVGFTIGSKGYVGTGSGSTTYNDFWAYNPASNSWTQKANFGGAARGFATGFSVGGKGYIGTKGPTQNDFWEYDTLANSWTQIAALGTGIRSAAVGFSVGGKGYVGTGSSNPTYYQDLWQYDPGTGAWTQMANIPGTPSQAARWGATAFSIGGKGYIAAGNYGSSQYKRDLWEYDPATNSWLQKADIPDLARYGSVGFSIGNKGYLVAGSNSAGNLQTFWEYSTFAPLTLFLSRVNSSCANPCNGKVTANAAGGTTPYTYQWNGGQSTQTITGLCAGTYSVIVTDGVGSTISANILVQ